ncbi:endogenous retrovirus group FC1 Env polyprotein [Phyllostomus discolor]|uniref:Endogenous retrovirus group FC1 Env polyprotein n=1 Tax=Phyllostomus discolor TaxID=89673 RepID=A0A6J2MM48_9CHIR|nr:endogenous retrovirus group FC1 Env polyprotein [Phyllostomus discolor]
MSRILEILFCTQVLSGLALKQPYVWRFYARETYEKGNNVITHTVGVVTCPNSGCRGLMTFTIKTADLESLKRWWGLSPALRLLKDQTEDYCKRWGDTYGGCPYNSCRFHSATIWDQIFPIQDPNDKEWERGVKGKIHVNIWHSGPVGDVFIVKVRKAQNPALNTIYHIQSVIGDQEKTLTRNLEGQKAVGPFSWIKLIQQGAQLLNLISPGSYNDCFLCAYLNRPPLTAVPLQQPLTVSKAQVPEPFSLQGVPLFQDSSIGALKCYGPPGSCNQTLPSSGSITSPPGTFFCCKRTLYRSVNHTILAPCYLVALAPQLILYQPGELSTLLAQERQKRAVLLPLMVGLSFATLIIGTGPGSSGLAVSLQSTKELREELNQAMDASALSMALLQRQITSLAWVAQQNRWALDLLTEETGRTCLLLQEDCCYYVNKSRIVEENIGKLKDIHRRLGSTSSPTETHSWWQSILFPILAPILGPLVILFLALTIGPCLLSTVVQQIEATVTQQAAAKILSLQRHHYWRLRPTQMESEYADYDTDARTDTSAV